MKIFTHPHRATFQIARCKHAVELGFLITPVCFFAHLGAAGAADSLRSAKDPEEVIVTAQRREQSLQEVPISVSVLGGEELDAATTSGVTEVLRSVAGFDADRRGNTSFFSLRGVTAAGGTTGTSAFYIDGVPYGFVRQSFYPNPNVYDLNRIEVLQGPQGTLYGANALNGVIRLLTNDANADEFEIKARTLISTTEDGDESTGGDVAVNVPLIDGRLGARFVAGFSNVGGWIDAPGRKDSNGIDTVDYRFKLHGRPSDSLSIDLSVWREEINRNQDDLSLDDRTIIDTIPSLQSDEFTTYGLSIRKDSAKFSLTSQTSYIDFGHEAVASGEALSPFFTARLRGTYDSAVFTQEFNVVSHLEGPWQWSAGAFYREGEDSQFLSLAFPATATPSVNDDFDDRSESYAIYGEVSRDLGEFNLAVGLRYFHDVETLTLGKDYDGRDVLPPAGPDFILAAGRSFDSESDAVTPRIVLTWAPIEDLNTYASVAQGFRSGFAQPPNVQALYPDYNQVDPDKLTSYELGVKGRAFDSRLVYEVALFYTHWRDAQQTVLVQLPPVPGAPTGLNASAVVADGALSGPGASFAISAELVDNFILGLNASWNDLVSDDTDDNALLKEGTRANLSPSFTAGGSLQYTWDLGRGFRARSSVSQTYKSPQNTDNSTESDAISITDLRLGIEAPKNWTFALYVDNVTDADGRNFEVGAFAPEWIGHPRPRTVGLQMEYQY